jgi:thiol:disulfide interchange protein DsbD
MFTALAAVLGLCTGVTAQSPAHFSASLSRQDIRRDEVFRVPIEIILDDDWHIYAPTTPPGGPVPTTITVDSTSAFAQTGDILQPPPIATHDPNFDLLVEFYGKATTLSAQVRVARSAPLGAHELAGAITYMLCNETSCLPPVTHTFTLAIDIQSGPPRTEYATAVQRAVPEIFDGTGSTVDVERALSAGLGAFLYLSVSMGFLALLTPCVFPMVPITVSFFTKQGEAGAQAATARVNRSLVYCLGIILTFTSLGIILASTLGASGAALFAANPWVNILIAVMFVVFAFSLFGLFEIQLPTSLVNRLSRSNAGGYAGILLMGLTFSVTSFTCTAPFVGTLLVLTTQGTWMWPIAGMLAFSTAFALPFFFLSLFPQSLNALPRSGGWLNSVRVVMGFLELAAALKFVSNVDLVWNWGVLPRELFLAIWIALFVVCGIYLLGKIRLPNDTPVESIGPFRLVSAIGCFAFTLMLTTGLSGGRLGELDAFFPPYSQSGDDLAFQGGPELEWLSDIDDALAAANTEGKPIFVDFTGYACTNCRWMEANVFTKPDIRRALGQYVRVQLYTDGQGEQYDRNRALQQERFGTVALPFYVVLTSTGKELVRFPGMTRDIARFQRFLDHALQSTSL